MISLAKTKSFDNGELLVTCFISIVFSFLISILVFVLFTRDTVQIPECQSGWQKVCVENETVMHISCTYPHMDGVISKDENITVVCHSDVVGLPLFVTECKSWDLRCER